MVPSLITMLFTFEKLKFRRNCKSIDRWPRSILFVSLLVAWRDLKYRYNYDCEKEGRHSQHVALSIDNESSIVKLCQFVIECIGKRNFLHSH